MERKSYQNLIIISVIAGLFGLAAITNIDKYGLGYDAGVHMSRGEALLHFYRTGRTDYRDLPEEDYCRFQIPDPDYQFHYPSFFFTRYQGGTSMGGITSAVTCLIFHKLLGWLDPVDAHNMASVLFGTLTIVVVFLFGLEAFNKRVAILSSLFLALYPLFIGYSHFSIKDLPVVFFVSLTIYCVWKGTVRNNYKWIFLSFIFLGMGMVSKFNAAFAVFILGAWIIFPIKNKVGVFSKLSAKLWGTLLISPVIVMLAYLLFAPRILNDYGYNIIKGLDRVQMEIFGIRHFTFRKKSFLSDLVSKAGKGKSDGTGKKSFVSDLTSKGKNGESDNKGAWRPYYSFVYVLITTPLPVLLLALGGVWFTLKRTRDGPGGEPWLVLSWAAVPVLFCALPSIAVYEGTREFMSFIPGICLLAGMGADSLYPVFEKFAANYLSPERISRLFLAFLMLMITFEAISVIQYHPYEVAFFNSLIGGLKGAQEIKIPFTSRVGIPDAGDNRGTSYRNAVEWINRHGKTNSILMIYGATANKFLPLKKGIKILPYVWDSTPKKRESVKRMKFETVYLVFNNTKWNRIHPIYGYCYQNLSPEYTLKANGAPISFVYRMSREEFLKLVFPNPNPA